MTGTESVVSSCRLPNREIRTLTGHGRLTFNPRQLRANQRTMNRALHPRSARPAPRRVQRSCSADVASSALCACSSGAVRRHGFLLGLDGRADLVRSPDSCTTFLGVTDATGDKMAGVPLPTAGWTAWAGADRSGECGLVLHPASPAIITAAIPAVRANGTARSARTCRPRRWSRPPSCVRPDTAYSWFTFPLPAVLACPAVPPPAPQSV